ncbi:MAG: sulfur carrier protein ThiS [Myxococcales bacterium]|nr:sulfur carrier protein ThiS [Myxococcales bacterium]MCB9735639.1 sulfur carrier protein ThiS [Deltaproteobacteria bacterium]
MNVTLNGDPKELPPDVGTVAQLVTWLGLGDLRVAVELNRRIVKRADHAATALGDGDVVEVVQFVGGGA